MEHPLMAVLPPLVRACRRKEIQMDEDKLPLDVSTKETQEELSNGKGD